MTYYDYRTYFQTLISNQEIVIENLDNILTFLSCFCFVFCCFFVYFIIRKMFFNK